MLFELDLPPDNSQIQDINIVTTQLYYSEAEMREFKELCKQGMVKMMPGAFDAGNISDFILAVLKLYANGELAK